MKRYAVRIGQSALKQIETFPAKIQKRLMSRIERLADNPRPRGVSKLQGPDDLYRLRVGDYRIVYAIRDNELLVLVAKVAHRRDVYR